MLTCVYEHGAVRSLMFTMHVNLYVAFWSWQPSGWQPQGTLHVNNVHVKGARIFRLQEQKVAFWLSRSGGNGRCGFQELKSIEKLIGNANVSWSTRCICEKGHTNSASSRLGYIHPRDVNEARSVVHSVYSLASNSHAAGAIGCVEVCNKSYHNGCSSQRVHKWSVRSSSAATSRRGRLHRSIYHSHSKLLMFPFRCGSIKLKLHKGRMGKSGAGTSPRGPLVRPIHHSQDQCSARMHHKIDDVCVSHVRWPLSRPIRVSCRHFQTSRCNKRIERSSRESSIQCEFTRPFLFGKHMLY